MFGFSLTKVLFTALVVAVIWWGFKAVAARGRINSGRINTSGQTRRKRVHKKQEPPFFKHSGADDDPEELVACPKCGVYTLPGQDCGCGKESASM